MAEMSTTGPVVIAASQVLAHVPSLARHGSKPSRELPRDPEVAAKFAASLRSFEDAVAYRPHQSYIGALHPRLLPARPWTDDGDPEASRYVVGGELMPEVELLGLLAILDGAGLFTLGDELADRAAGALARHPLAKHLDLDRIDKARGTPKPWPEPWAVWLCTPAARPSPPPCARRRRSRRLPHGRRAAREPHLQGHRHPGPAASAGRPRHRSGVDRLRGGVWRRGHR